MPPHGLKAQRFSALVSMSAAYREQCDVITRIPMAGSASSLNVASATSIFLYEIARQRGWVSGSR